MSGPWGIGGVAVLLTDFFILYVVVLASCGKVTYDLSMPCHKIYQFGRFFAKKLPAAGTYTWCNLCKHQYWYLSLKYQYNYQYSSLKYKYQYQYLKTVPKYSSATSTSTQYYNPVPVLYILSS